MLRSLCSALLLLATLSLCAQSAQAGFEYRFSNITNNTPAGVNIASQLRVTVDDAGSGQVGFTFRNLVGVASSVRRVFFDQDDSLAAVLSFSAPPLTWTSGISGVEFYSDGSPGTLPGGNSLSPIFEEDYSASAASPPPKRGLNEHADSLTVLLNLEPGRALSDVVGSIADGALRMGLHVQSIDVGGGNDKSDSFVNHPTPIPAPGAAVLGAIGLGTAVLSRARRLF